MTGVSLYFRYLGASLRSQMQYRSSFLMGSISRFLVTGLEFISILALFDRFGALEGWRLEEVGLLYGMANMAFALAEGFGRGFDAFAQMIRNGTFDRLLLRPRSTALQVAGTDVQALRLGRLMQGLFVLLWASATLHVQWTIGRILLLAVSIAGGTCLFIGLFVLQATLAFWTTESLEIVNAVTYGGVETAQYPLTVYRDWFRDFFFYVIPLGAVTYLPALAITGRPDPLGTSRLVQIVAPLMGIVFLLAALQVWKIGVRHYRSTGS